MLSRQELLQTIEEGLDNGRIAPHLAAYIAAEILDVEAHATGYDDRVRIIDDRPGEHRPLQRA
jgi:hypothetical protein